MAALNIKGFSLYCLAKYHDAIDWYDRILTLDSKISLVWTNKGNALNKLGKHRDAKKCYEEASNIQKTGIDHMIHM
jgi:tetratricopeptide (TPR) repeat protein